MRKLILIVFLILIIISWVLIFQNYQKDKIIKHILENIEKEDFMFFFVSASPRDEKILDNRKDLKFIYENALNDERILDILEEKKEKNSWIKFLIGLIKSQKNK